MPEILPIVGKRLYISYPGQLRQCRKCFEQGHASASCTKPKVDWLDYVLMLMNSGTFRRELFDGWKQALELYRPDPRAGDLRNVINFNKNQQIGTGGTEPSKEPSAPSPQTPQQPNQPTQPPINPWGNQSPWQDGSRPWQTQGPWQNSGQGWQNSGWSNTNQNWQRGRGCGRGRGRINTQRNFGPNY